MLRSIKKVMVVGAVAAIGALASPAMASADGWELNGSPITAPVASVATAGTIAQSIPALGLVTSCDIEGTMTLNPDGGGEIDPFSLPTSCATNVTGCTAEITHATAPWGFSSTAPRIHVSDVSFLFYYTGCGTLDGYHTEVANGEVSPVFNPSTQCFELDAGSNSFTMDGAIPATFTGEVCITDGSNVWELVS